MVLFLEIVAPRIDAPLQDDPDGVALEMRSGVTPEMNPGDTASAQHPGAAAGKGVTDAPSNAAGLPGDSGRRRIIGLELPTPTGKPARAGVRESEDEPELYAKVLGTSPCIDVSKDSLLLDAAAQVPAAVDQLHGLPTP